MVKLKALRQRDRGAVTVLVAVLLGFGVLLPVTALVIDVGSIYVESEELQSGADAAAMVVAQGCAAGKCVLAADITNERAVARSHASANAKDGHTAVTDICGNWGSLPACTTQSTSQLSTCVGSKPTGNYVEVRVATETSSGGTMLPPAFARSMVGNSTYKGTQVANCARVSVSDVCVQVAQLKFKHTFNGSAGTATISTDQKLCPGQEQKFTLVSYTAPSAAFAVPQYIYDSDSQSITATNKSL